MSKAKTCFSYMSNERILKKKNTRARKELQERFLNASKDPVELRRGMTVVQSNGLLGVIVDATESASGCSVKVWQKDLITHDTNPENCVDYRFEGSYTDFFVVL